MMEFEVIGYGQGVLLIIVVLALWAALGAFMVIFSRSERRREKGDRPRKPQEPTHANHSGSFGR